MDLIPLLRRPARVLAAAALVTAASGCATWSGVRFAPSPFEVAVAPDADAPALGQAVFSWQGIVEEADGYVARFHVRVRNESAADLRLLPTRCELVDNQLRAFGRPLVELIEGDDAALGLEPLLAPGDVAVWSLSFPFSAPPSEKDLDGLHLTLALADAAGGIQVSATFDRLRPQADGSFVYGGGWYGNWQLAGFGVGSTWGTRRGIGWRTPHGSLIW